MTTRIAMLLITVATTLVAFADEASAAKVVAARKPAGLSTDDIQDVLYLGQDRVVVVRLHVRVDGKSYAAVWNAYVDDLFRDLDANGDKTLSGVEINGIPSITDLSRMGIRTTSANGRLPTINRNSADVSPRDGKVTRAELGDYLIRAGARPFTVAISRPNTNERRLGFRRSGINTSAGSQLFDLLDRNKDGKLSKQELRNAGESLRKHDLDEDETISSAELLPPRSPFYASAMSSRSATAPSSVFISLAAGIPATRLVRQLIDKYDRATEAAAAGVDVKDNKLSAAELGIDAAALAAADADGDGRLDFTELRQFLQKPTPSMELVLRLGRRKPGEPVVQLVSSAGNLKSRVKVVSQTLASLALDNVNFDINAGGSQAGGWYSTAGNYDAQFDAADADKNGYLDKKEVVRSPVFRNAFDAMDRNNDGKVFKKEMRAYVKNQTAAANSRTVLSITDQGRDFFKILDLNRDQRLSATELEAAIGRIETWDIDNDGVISKAEIPRQYRMTLERGRPSGLSVNGIVAVAYPGGPAMRRTATDGPDWFRKMDRNGDGEVSRKEFLGKLQLFDKIDANKNGRIDPDEAGRATTAKNSKKK